MKRTIWENLIIYLKDSGGLVNGGDIERLKWVNKEATLSQPETYFKPSNISRRLRELDEVGIIYSMEENSVFYKYQTPEEIKTKARMLPPLEDKKQRLQKRMYDFVVSLIPLSREEEERRLAVGLPI